MLVTGFITQWHVDSMTCVTSCAATGHVAHTTYERFLHVVNIFVAKAFVHNGLLLLCVGVVTPQCYDLAQRQRSDRI